jgi:hypothetical protein
MFWISSMRAMIGSCSTVVNTDTGHSTFTAAAQNAMTVTGENSTMARPASRS